jgi:hypothetical protein
MPDAGSVGVEVGVEVGVGVGEGVGVGVTVSGEQLVVQTIGLLFDGIGRRITTSCANTVEERSDPESSKAADTFLI